MTSQVNLQNLPGLWLIVNEKVYDVTKFTDHPGGYEILKTFKGLDATAEFTKANHPAGAIEDMKSFYKCDVPYITQEELSHHKSEDDCWLAIHGKAYDVSKFKKHPGGHEILVDNAGRDASKAFDDIDHSLTAKQDLENYYLGHYVPGEVKDEPKSQNFQLVIAAIIAILGLIIRNYLLS